MIKLQKLIDEEYRFSGSKQYWRLTDYLHKHKQSFADLIEAAKSQHTDCKVLRCDVCAALSKIED